MAFNPENITKNHVLNALEEIRNNELTNELTTISPWHVIIDNNTYAPREVMRYAHKQLNGEKIWLFEGGKITNSYLTRMGFEVKRNDNNNVKKVNYLIKKYRNKLEQDQQLGDEEFKWNLIKEFYGRPDINAEDFKNEFESIDYDNLMDFRFKGVRNELLEQRIQDYKRYLDELFDETQDLKKRITNFIGNIKNLYKNINSKNKPFHDERTIATLLTFRYPGKYTFYKAELYNKFCNSIGIKPKREVGEKYIHYLELIDFLIYEYIKTDKKLIQIIDQILTGKSESLYLDKERKILAQDILWRNFEYENKDVDNTKKANNQKNKIEPVNIKQPLNLILYGPPGTGKTYDTINRALEILDRNYSGERNRNMFEDYLNKKQIFFVTFHQSMSYEDFVEGIKPILSKNREVSGDNENLEYEISDGIFKQACAMAAYNCYIKFKKNNLTEETFEDILRKFNNGEFNEAVKKCANDSQPVVLIIDEINRGNIAQILGELITLIEEDKRLGNSEAVSVILPYSKKEFSVPANLYIIGTMNTADRSVEALDTALRRRFSFEGKYPCYDLEELKEEFAGYTIGKILETINNRIEKLLDKDHLIGHSYFIIKDDKNTQEKLQYVFYKKIIPLLQEYFYGDYGKIGLVLGEGFVKIKNAQTNDSTFANFEYDGKEELEERVIYEIIENKNEKEFEDAIRKLMNNKVN